jgi:hypothetical protein
MPAAPARDSKLWKNERSSSSLETSIAFCEVQDLRVTWCPS